MPYILSKRKRLLSWTLAWGVVTSWAAAADITGRVVDAITREPLACRVYLEDAEGKAYFVTSDDAAGQAVPYDKTNWLNARAQERHTSISAHPFRATVPAGHYRVTVERGKEYFPVTLECELGADDQAIEVELRRWAQPAQTGWYSGETHIHRSLAELPVLMLSEDLNVALPLTYWVTRGGEPPSQGDKNQPGEVPAELLHVDKTHVIWPRNTEYEIFSLGAQRHTLGALFVLNHQSVLDQGVPPWGGVARQARAEGALLDMDKLDWPVAMTLPPATGATLYELANNHLWRTEFGFRDWNVVAAPYLQPPWGGRGGNERQWLDYTLGMYYTLLNAGFPLVPTAGTASGVHPVPVGFSRVYVKMPAGESFSFQNWWQGLQQGRSFVTTGPFLEVQLNGREAGERMVLPANDSPHVDVAGLVTSEQRLAFAEVIVNGIAIESIMPQNEPTESGAYRTRFSRRIPITQSGWICVRCYEDRSDGRLRFAHTAPWWIEVPGKPLQVRAEERVYLVQRMQDEIARSDELVPPAARQEYQTALQKYAELPVADPPASTPRLPTDDAHWRFWLENMFVHHQFRREEVLQVLGITPAELDAKIAELQFDVQAVPPKSTAGKLKVLPYPGGRHPRIGFLEGALQPQRDTKLSVFVPWSERDYVVVDVPEAIFSQLGLTYLAHTHIPTIWDHQGVKLEPVEWERSANGEEWAMQRSLPNGIVFGVEATPGDHEVNFRLWLRNGSLEKLQDMRAQVCVMLAAATGFSARMSANKVSTDEAIAVQDETGERWIISAWQPVHRVWQNPPVPCLHTDPRLPNCDVGATVEAHGCLRFYEGRDIQKALQDAAAAVKKPRTDTDGHG